jgi:3-methyladenine DNA glycosylase AlkD
VSALADEIDGRIRALPLRTTESIRGIRREFSKRLRVVPAAEVLAVADALVHTHRWVGYELLYCHPGGVAALGLDDVERLGRGLSSWGDVDAFGRYVSGPAWQLRRIPDEAVHRWAAATDRWWRRAALVSTVPLNLRAAGGTGDTRRTLEVCGMLVRDRDDMVVKALSWALRALVEWDPAAVRGFLDAHAEVLAARVRREVRTKLEFGLKNVRVRALG